MNVHIRIFPNRIYQCVILFLIIFSIAVCAIADISNEISNILMYAIMFVLTAIAFYGVNWKKRHKLLRASPFPPPKAIIYPLLAILLLELIYKAILYFIGAGDMGAEHPKSYTALMLLSITLAGPIVEEFIFRGVFLRGLLTRYTPKTAIVATSLLFSLVHCNLAPEASMASNVTAVIYAFLMSIIFSYSYHKTPTLLICALLHIVANTTSLAASAWF